MEKEGPKPKISNIKVMIEGKTEATEHGVKIGMPLKITFDVTFEEGTIISINKGILQNGKVEYTTDGTETKVLFMITGKIGETEVAKKKEISVEKFYREISIADIVEVGDFVNYSVGNWTEQDIEKLGDLYAGTSLPGVLGKFGGFDIGTSKDGNITPYGNYANKYSGWRVLSKNEDGSINIIHAGTPEGFANSGILGLTILEETRDWSMYEDSSIDSIDTNYAVEGSARSVKFYEELEGFANTDTVKTTGSYYWTTSIIKSATTRLMRVAYSGISGKADGLYCFGIRPVVTLKHNVIASTTSENTSHQEPENAWELSMQ